MILLAERARVAGWNLHTLEKNHVQETIPVRRRDQLHTWRGRMGPSDFAREDALGGEFSGRRDGDVVVEKRLVRGGIAKALGDTGADPIAVLRFPQERKARRDGGVELARRVEARAAHDQRVLSRFEFELRVGAKVRDVGRHVHHRLRGITRSAVGDRPGVERLRADRDEQRVGNLGACLQFAARPRRKPEIERRRRAIAGR